MSLALDPAIVGCAAVLHDVSVGVSERVRTFIDPYQGGSPARYRYLAAATEPIDDTSTRKLMEGVLSIDR